MDKRKLTSHEWAERFEAVEEGITFTIAEDDDLNLDANPYHAPNGQFTTGPAGGSGAAARARVEHTRSEMLALGYSQREADHEAKKEAYKIAVEHAALSKGHVKEIPPGKFEDMESHGRRAAKDLEETRANLDRQQQAALDEHNKLSALEGAHPDHDVPPEPNSFADASEGMRDSAARARGEKPPSDQFEYEDKSEARDLLHPDDAPEPPERPAPPDPLPSNASIQERIAHKFETEDYEAELEAYHKEVADHPGELAAFERNLEAQKQEFLDQASRTQQKFEELHEQQVEALSQLREHEKTFTKHRREALKEAENYDPEQMDDDDDLTSLDKPMPPDPLPPNASAAQRSKHERAMDYYAEDVQAYNEALDDPRRLVNERHFAQYDRYEEGNAREGEIKDPVANRDYQRAREAAQNIVDRRIAALENHTFGKSGNDDAHASLKEAIRETVSYIKDLSKITKRKWSATKRKVEESSEDDE